VVRTGCFSVPDRAQYRGYLIWHSAAYSPVSSTSRASRVRRSGDADGASRSSCCSSAGPGELGVRSPGFTAPSELQYKMWALSNRLSLAAQQVPGSRNRVAPNTGIPAASRSCPAWAPEHCRPSDMLRADRGCTSAQQPGAARFGLLFQRRRGQGAARLARPAARRHSHTMTARSSGSVTPRASREGVAHDRRAR